MTTEAPKHSLLTRKLIELRARDTRRLNASEAAKVIHARHVEQGTLGHGISLPDIEQAVIRVRQRRVQMALQARPPRRGEDDDKQPTAERLAKGDVGRIVVPTIGRKFKTKSPVEHYSGQWPSHVESAFETFVFDSEAGEYGRVTVNYGGSGGGVPGNSLGGLGNASDRARDAHERYVWVRSRLSPEALETLDSLVLQLRADAHTVNLETFGQRLFPSIRDRATRRGISIGALRIAGDQLAALYRKYAVLSYEPRHPMKEIT